MATKTKTDRAAEAEARRIAEEGDFVTVRALERGYAGNMIHNAGEVFEMDTAGMRPWPLQGKEQPVPEYDTKTVKTPRGTFEVPPWVAEVDPDAVKPEELAPKGHQTQHRDPRISPI